MSNDKPTTARPQLTLGTTPKCLKQPGADLLPGRQELVIPENQQPRLILPRPAPGLVVLYDYTWHEDFARKGESEKPRPCLIMAVRPNKDRPRNPEVIVAPITHTPPSKELLPSSVKIPKDLGKSVGLDNQRSYIRCHEVNVFEWPGPDLTTIPGNKDRPKVSYGLLDKDLFDQVKQTFRSTGKQLVVRRDPAFDPADHGL